MSPLSLDGHDSTCSLAGDYGPCDCKTTPPASAPAASPEAVDVGYLMRMVEENLTPEAVAAQRGIITALLMTAPDFEVLRWDLAAHPTPAPERVAPVALDELATLLHIWDCTMSHGHFGNRGHSSTEQHRKDAARVIAAYAETRP